MPIETTTTVDATCDSCGNSLTDRWGETNELYCGNCLEEKEEEKGNVEDTLSNLQEEFDELKGHYEELEDDYNAAQAEIERLKES